MFGLIAAAVATGNFYLIPIILTTPGPVENVMAQVTQVITLMIDVMTDLLANPFFAFLFACGFVKIGMTLIRKAKKASR